MTRLRHRIRRVNFIHNHTIIRIHLNGIILILRLKHYRSRYAPQKTEAD